MTAARDPAVFRPDGTVFEFERADLQRLRSGARPRKRRRRDGREKKGWRLVQKLIHHGTRIGHDAAFDRDLQPVVNIDVWAGIDVVVDNAGVAFEQVRYHLTARIFEQRAAAADGHAHREILDREIVQPQRRQALVGQLIIAAPAADKRQIDQLGGHHVHGFLKRGLVQLKPHLPADRFFHEIRKCGAHFVKTGGRHGDLFHGRIGAGLQKPVQLVEVHLDGLDIGNKVLPEWRQLHARRHAVKDQLAELLFQRLERVGEHGLRDEKVVGCLIDRACFCDFKHVFELDQGHKRSLRSKICGHESLPAFSTKHAGRFC